MSSVYFVSLEFYSTSKNIVKYSKIVSDLNTEVDTSKLLKVGSYLVSAGASNLKNRF
jgi:hypothetical protein